MTGAKPRNARVRCTGRRARSPLWVICRHAQPKKECLLPPLKADIRASGHHVGYGPILLQKSVETGQEA
jgi:hypothetical protein